MANGSSLDDEVACRWLRARALLPGDDEHPDWGIRWTMSTVALSEWLTRRSRIPADALWFGGSIHRQAGWRAHLMTRDKSFELQWTASRPLEVTSSSLVHRHRTPWPEPTGPDDLPLLVPQVGKLLNKPFVRAVEVEVYSLKNGDLETLRKWLEPVSDAITIGTGKVTGKLPVGVECEVFEKGSQRWYTIRFDANEPLVLQPE